ncbi:MAG TPA: WbqC family protein [Burkholderiales bacterium]|jgi:hypothetical protein|nr:WbqC family protein [Burkholderiales bacterium]
MVVAIHQPHFLPWLGYLHRMAQAGLFVILDHVQFERGNYQNRTRIRMGEEARWLTVPVVQRSQKERIVDKEVDNRLEGDRWWPRVHFGTLRHAYRDAGYFGAYGPALQDILQRRWEKLADLNQALLDMLRDAFGIRTPLVRSSALQLEGAKSELILNICREVGADTLLAGFGGSRTYLDAEAFARAGVRIAYHEFEHPVYKQAGAAPFIPGLSSIDLLFNCGPQSARVLLGEQALHESCAAA